MHGMYFCGVTARVTAMNTHEFSISRNNPSIIGFLSESDQSIT